MAKKKKNERPSAHELLQAGLTVKYRTTYQKGGASGARDHDTEAKALARLAEDRADGYDVDLFAIAVVPRGGTDTLLLCQRRWGDLIAIAETYPAGRKTKQRMILRYTGEHWKCIGSGPSWGKAYTVACSNMIRFNR